MLDISRLHIIRRDDETTRGFSFVGVRRSAENGYGEFWLPLGFGTFPDRSYEETRTWFFLLYRILRSYAAAADLEDRRPSQRRDPILAEEKGDDLALLEPDPLLTYSRLSAFERVLESFDELAVASVIANQAKREPTRYDRIDCYLDQAIFQDDHSAYIAEMASTRLEIRTNASDLVGLFSFIYSEIRAQIEPGSLPAEIASQARVFRERYLQDEAGLFDEHAASDLVPLLREILVDIDRATAYKDADYWALYEALEDFLWSDPIESADGVLWGITDFHPVWEELGHAYARKAFGLTGTPRVAFAHNVVEANRTVANQRVYTEFGVHPMYIEYHGRRRSLLPDLILISDEPTERLQKEFERHFVVRRTPEDAPIYAQATVRLAQPSRTRERWLRALQQRLIERHHRAAISGVVLQCKSVPARTFDAAYAEVRDDWVAQIRARTRDELFVVDFKYHHLEDFIVAEPSRKLCADVLKQHAYEFAMQQYADVTLRAGYKIESEFCIPIYSPNASSTVVLPNESVLNSDGLASYWKRQRVTVVALPIHLATEAFLQEAR